MFSYESATKLTKSYIYTWQSMGCLTPGYIQRHNFQQCMDTHLQNLGGSRIPSGLGEALQLFCCCSFSPSYQHASQRAALTSLEKQLDPRWVVHTSISKETFSNLKFLVVQTHYSPSSGSAHAEPVNLHLLEN